MKPDAARRSVGAEVLYTAHHGATPQHAKITGGSTFPNALVMICLDGASKPVAVPAAKLEFSHVLTPPIRKHTPNSTDQDRCVDPGCGRRHEWEIDCSCGREFFRFTARKAKACAQAHQVGQEKPEPAATAVLEPQP